RSRPPALGRLRRAADRRRRLAGGGGRGLRLAARIPGGLRHRVQRGRALHPAADRRGPGPGRRRAAARQAGASAAQPAARRRARRSQAGGRRMTLDLPLIWAAIIAVGVLMYVLLDGMDLGLGILFPFAATPEERDVMMDTVAPVWDGNETWLVLGGGGLFAAFPAAYAALFPALYVPLLLMLLALILRGVAFEFRARGRRRGKAFWTGAFYVGSIVATLAQ